MSLTNGFLKLFRHPRSSSAFIDQQDFTYYKPGDLRCHSFELFDRRSVSANLLTASEPLQCSVCRLLVTAQHAVCVCQVCGYACHDKCLSQAVNQCSSSVPHHQRRVNVATKVVPSAQVSSSCDVTMSSSVAVNQLSVSQPPYQWSSVSALPQSEHDVDVTYITERIISVLFSAEGGESQYRTRWNKVSEMLHNKHPNSCLIINLSERSDVMHQSRHKVLDFGWPDTLAPPLERLCNICKSIESWLNLNVKNVVVLHCRIGLSRLSVVIAAYIDYSNVCTSDEQRLDQVAMKHFYDDKLHDATQPSQRRYVHYFAGLLSAAIRINNSALYLQQIRLRDLSGLASSTVASTPALRFFVKIYQSMQPVYVSGIYSTAGTAETRIEMERGHLQLRSDILVKCYAVSAVTSQLSPRSDVKLLFRCQFHTSALSSHCLEFSASDLDVEAPAHGQRSLEGLRVEFRFSPTSSSTAWYDNDVVGTKASHVTGSAQVDGLERWNSYENFSALSTSLSPLKADGGVKSLLRDNSESGAMSGLSAASKLSAAMQSVNPTTQLAPQSQHHVEEYHQQEQSADGTSSAMAAARRELHFTVAQGDENVEQKTYTKTWEVGGGQLLGSDGGAIHTLSPLVRGTTDELEERHAQLDEVLVGLLNEATANKGQAPSSGSVTLTSQRVSRSQPQVKQYTETSTLLKTAQKQIDESQRAVADTPSRRRPDTDDVIVNGRHEPKSRPYASDTEDQMAWLDDQRSKLRSGRRSGWRERSAYEKQLVSELRSAQTALSSQRDPRARTYSESEMLDTAGLPRRGRRSEPPSYQSDRYEVKPGRYVSGVERRPFTTQQTLYTFGVSPQRTTSLDQGLYYSPAVPERNDSSREAMARQRRSHEEEQRRYHTYSTTETRTTRNQSSVNELDDTLNSLLLNSVTERPAVEKEEEIISLQPIGRGVHNLEPSAQSPEIKTSPMTSSFPTDVIQDTVIEENISLHPIGRGVHNLEPSAQSPGFNTSPVTSSFPTDDVVVSTFPLTPVTPYDNAGSRLVASQSMPSSLSHVEQVVENQSVQYRQPVQNMSRTVNYEAHSTNTLVDGGYRDSMPVLSRSTLPPGGFAPTQAQPYVNQAPGTSYTLPSQQSTVTSITTRQFVIESQQRQQEFEQQRREHLVKQQEIERQQQELQRQQRDLEQQQRERQRQQQLVEQQEQQRQLELKRQQEIQRQMELQYHQEIQRQKEAELQRQQEERRQQELQRQQELIRHQEYERQQKVIQQQELRRQEQEIEQQRQEIERQQRLLEQQELQFQQQQQQQQVVKQYVMREERSTQPVMNDVQIERVVTIPRTGQDYTGSHGFVSSGDSTMQNGFVSQRVYQTQQRTWTGHAVGQSLSVDTSSQHTDQMSGLDSSRLSAGRQLAVSPGAYMGYSRTESFSSMGDNVELSLQTPRFVRDTSQLWHRANISRDEAIQLLKDKPPGSFVVRNSSSFQGSFGLAVKVAHLPPNVQVKGGSDPEAELVRHFLIETTSKGVRLKGCNNEPTFGSLAALVYQHSITPLALPCKLLLPTATEVDVDWVDGNTMPQLMTHGAACNVVYVNSIDVESLTGAVAVTKAIERTFTTSKILPKTTVVHFKVTSQGITLTDNKRRVFFRRYYPLESVTYCGLDSQDRRWTLSVADSEPVTSRLFGFVARKSGSATDNSCHLFAEMDPSQPATAIVSFVEKLLVKHGHCLK